ncbi:GatB/YqeY domain-containing protein [Aquibaculum arenosum]|uniref:GatB/YqeY domain-containing protein n=1 Tax=Aquibaculum arenosum TaxID=3032591 RepID=A0ABT5YMZ6_9PROT|nr:GatB/YqeY domain-containing protein [Fodinicurvata sp. CAU 1616]MDF2096343.1 GatB/YqeY domain-containing protein [Fodinicurvata sp. CAU 1616]
MLRSELNDALKGAMKAKEQQALATVRLILAALKDRDIQARSSGNADGIDDQEILELLQKMVKQRRESIVLYEKGGRDDLVAREEAEIAVIERFLPQGLSAEQTEAAVDQAIAEVEAQSIKDMGRVMALLKERYAGRMEFAKASQMVKQRLA